MFDAQSLPPPRYTISIHTFHAFLYTVACLYTASSCLEILLSEGTVKVVVVSNPSHGLSNLYIAFAFLVFLIFLCYLMTVFFRKNITSLSRLDHDRMIGMLLHEANSRLISASAANGTECVRRLTAADVRGACVWGNHSNSQVRGSVEVVTIYPQ